MASYKEILQAQMCKFKDLKEQERAELEALNRLSIDWQTLDRARADIKANFERRRNELREDPNYKAALLQNFGSNLFHFDENAWIREEPIWCKWQEEPKPTQLQEEPKPDENEDERIWIICPKCGEKDHEPGAKFCHICSADLSTGKTKEQEDNEKSEEQKKKSKKRRRKNRWNKNNKRER